MLVWLSLALAILGGFNYLRWLKISVYETKLNKIEGMAMISREASIIQAVSSVILLVYMCL